MVTLTDAAFDVGLDPSCCITASGFLAFSAGNIVRVLRHVKDRTPKEIENFVKKCLDELDAHLQKEARI